MRLGCSLAVIALATLMICKWQGPAFARASQAPNLKGSRPKAFVLPPDLDAFVPSSMTKRHFFQAVAAQILLFGGFSPSPHGWVRDVPGPSTLLQRLERIQPTWKSGQVDYSLSARGPLSLFHIASSGV